jgi:hypothetical protein
VINVSDAGIIRKDGGSSAIYDFNGNYIRHI